jgi:hypothetical protein
MELFKMSQAGSVLEALNKYIVAFEFGLTIDNSNRRVSYVRTTGSVAKGKQKAIELLVRDSRDRLNVQIETAVLKDEDEMADWYERCPKSHYPFLGYGVKANSLI